MAGGQSWAGGDNELTADVRRGALGLSLRVLAGIDESLGHVSQFDVQVLGSPTQNSKAWSQLIRSRSIRIPWAWPITSRLTSPVRRSSSSQAWEEERAWSGQHGKDHSLPRLSSGEIPH
jgi:hypothetical protein